VQSLSDGCGTISKPNTDAFPTHSSNTCPSPVSLSTEICFGLRLAYTARDGRRVAHSLKSLLVLRSHRKAGLISHTPNSWKPRVKFRECRIVLPHYGKCREACVRLLPIRGVICPSSRSKRTGRANIFILTRRRSPAAIRFSGGRSFNSCVKPARKRRFVCAVSPATGSADFRLTISSAQRSLGAILLAVNCARFPSRQKTAPFELHLRAVPVAASLVNFQLLYSEQCLKLNRHT